MMMYKIDLLKGEGVPPRPQPLGVALSVATIVVPVVVLLVLIGLALDSRITTAVRQRELSKVRTSLDRTAEALKQRESLQKTKADATLRLREVKDLLALHTQWTEVLSSIAEYIPPSLTLTSVTVRQEQARTQRSGQKKSGKTEAPTPLWRMEMRISDEGRMTDSEDVRVFRDRLYRCPALESRLRPIEVTQQPGRLGDREVTNYQLECVFEGTD